MKLPNSRPPDPSRRRFLQIVGVQGAALFAGTSRGFCAVRGNPELVTWRGIAMGTEVSIQLFSGDPEVARAVLNQCRDEILRLENIFSLYDARSAVGRLNGDGFLERAPAELLELFELTHRFSELTEGAFDVTIHSVCELLANATTPMDDKTIEQALALVDYRRIIREGETVRFGKSGMQVTFNGVAQGFVTDAISSLLRQRGFNKTLVDLGEKRALGPRTNNQPWRIGVESPLNRSELAGVVELDDRAVATSGGYGQTYVAGGHHLLDARSGSSGHEFSSVSVLAPTAVVADALSTSLAVLDRDHAEEVLKGFPEVEVFVIRNGRARLSRIT